jgi:hypothetical protein
MYTYIQFRLLVHYVAHAAARRGLSYSCMLGSRYGHVNIWIGHIGVFGLLGTCIPGGKKANKSGQRSNNVRFLCLQTSGTESE